MSICSDFLLPPALQSRDLVNEKKKNTTAIQRSI